MCVAICTSCVPTTYNNKVLLTDCHICLAISTYNRHNVYLFQVLLHHHKTVQALPCQLAHACHPALSSADLPTRMRVIQDYN